MAVYYISPGVPASVASSLLIPRPVGTLVLDSSGDLWRSTNASVATYVRLGASGDILIPDTDTLTFGTGSDVVFTADGTNVTVEQGAGAGLLLNEVGVFRIVDTTDNTKRISFVASGITAGQTRSLTMPDSDVSLLLTPGNITTTDPGTGVAIPVTQSTSISLTIGAGAETNTLANPTAAGQRLSLVAGSVGGGTRAITAAAAINQTGNTIMTFAQANDWILLWGVNINGNLRWRVGANDGVALS